VITDEEKHELLEEKLDYLRHDGPSKCQYCNGNGSLSVDGGSLAYRCPDCGGSGVEEEDMTEES